MMKHAESDSDIGLEEGELLLRLQKVGSLNSNQLKTNLCIYKGISALLSFVTSYLMF